MYHPRRIKVRRTSWLVALLLAIVASESRAQPDTDALPRRPTDRPLMTTSVPHMQVNVTPRISVHDLLFRSVFALPDVENRPAGVVGARTISLPDTLMRENRRGGDPGVPATANGVGHIHADGSLHVNLPEDRIRDVVNARWGARHPSIRDYVMLFTPQSRAELAVTFQLVVEAYNRATGRALVASDYLAPAVRPLTDAPVDTVWVVSGEPRFHDERRCTYLLGKDVEEAHIYDLGPSANPHVCVLPTPATPR
jgi:phospholipase/carboxylesterase